MRSKASMEFRTCSSKKAYTTLEEARAVARIRSRECGYPLYVYHCRLCNHKHLTKHMPLHIERQQLQHQLDLIDARIAAQNKVLFLIQGALKSMFDSRVK